MLKKLENLVEEIKKKNFIFVLGQADCFNEYHLKSFEGHFEDNGKDYYHFSLNNKNKTVRISKLILTPFMNIQIPLGKVSYDAIDQFLWKAETDFYYLYLNELRSVVY